MEFDINKKEKKLIERYDKDEVERRINNFYKRNKKVMSKKWARENYILDASKYLAKATPSRIYE